MLRLNQIPVNSIVEDTNIQIQPMLRLNKVTNFGSYQLLTIQIQPMLRLNWKKVGNGLSGVFNSNTTNVKVKHFRQI